MASSIRSGGVRRSRAATGCSASGKQLSIRAISASSSSCPVRPLRWRIISTGGHRRERGERVPADAGSGLGERAAARHHDERAGRVRDGRGHLRRVPDVVQEDDWEADRLLARAFAGEPPAQLGGERRLAHSGRPVEDQGAGPARGLVGQLAQLAVTAEQPLHGRRPRGDGGVRLLAPPARAVGGVVEDGDPFA
ncbi:hypothetical protein RB200_23940 [Streptomyces sp. PmtG]